MKKYFFILCTALTCTIHGATNCEPQPPLTKEMVALGCTNFPDRARQIVNVYIHYTHEEWQKRIEQATVMFTTLKEREAGGESIKNLIAELWILSKDYDLAQANDELSHIFFSATGDIAFLKNRDWALFFCTGRPTRVHEMERSREAFMRQKDLFLDPNAWFYHRDDEPRTRSSSDTSHYRGGSGDATPPSGEEGADKPLLEKRQNPAQTPQTGLRQRKIYP